MNWFQQNKFLGSYLVGLGLVTLLVGAFLLHEKGVADNEQTRLETTAAERARLRRSVPFPEAANLAKTRAQSERYRRSLGALENELKARTLPRSLLQPNEFQGQLRQAVNGVLERAAASKVQLPDNFFLGFDEYASSLPNPVAAPLLGQELKAIELLLNRLVDAHVDAVGSLTRVPLSEEKPAVAPTPTPPRARGRAVSPAGPIVTLPITAHVLELSFAASPAAARKFLNEVATAHEQLFIIRTLTVRNQVADGPKREAAPETTATPTPPPVEGASPGAVSPVVTFIVGAEHLDVTARVDIISLTGPVKEVR